MKNRKYIALIIAASMTAGLAACGSSSTTTTAATESSAADTSAAADSSTVESTDAEKKAENETTVTARVDSVDGNTIKVTLGELAGPGGMKGGPGGNGGPGRSSSDTSGSSEAQNGSTQTPPEMPEGEAPADMGGDASAAGNGQTPPEIPAGEAPADMGGDASAAGNGQTPPEMPAGEAPADMGGMPGDMDLSSMFTASEETATYTIEESMLDGITLQDIKEGTILSITLDADGNVTKVAEPSMGGPGGMGGHGGPGGNGGPGGGQDASSIEYTAVTSYTEDTETSGETYSSTGTDENAVLVENGANVTIDGATVTRESSDSTGGDNSSFYGVGAALLTKDGTLTVSNSTITTDAAGGAGVFAYGDGTAYVKDTSISTTQGTSGGIHVAGGGTLYAWNLNVETDGGSAAAIRSDRGGGTMVVDGGSYTSNGSGSPAVYTTADITINDADLTATGSEAVCIEGLNTLRLFDCDLTGNMPDSDQNDNTWTVIVYQSMSGDSEIGTGNFSMVGGTLTSKNGGLFYTTNTESEILLSDVDITYSDDDDFLLQVTGNANERGWGSTGTNGAQCNFTADDQELQGTVIYDSISTLDFYLTNESTLTGTFVDDETWAGEGGDGYCNVYVDADSKWVVTGDATIDDLYSAGTITDEGGKTVTIKGEDGTVYVEGDSTYTITVASYTAEDNTDGALTVPSYSNYEVEEK